MWRWALTVWRTTGGRISIWGPWWAGWPTASAGPASPWAGGSIPWRPTTGKTTSTAAWQALTGRCGRWRRRGGPAGPLPVQPGRPGGLPRRPVGPGGLYPLPGGAVHRLLGAEQPGHPVQSHQPQLFQSERTRQRSGGRPVYPDQRRALYPPADGGSIPTGELAPVEGTPMDLRAGGADRRADRRGLPQLTMAGGYDHNWVVDGPAGTLRPAARAWSEETGIVLAVSTTMPGVQFYTGNYLDGCPAGKGNAPYGKRWGFCLGDPVLPGRRPPSGVPQPGAAGRGGVPAGDPVLLLRGQMSGCGPEAYCLRPAFLFVRFRGSASSPGCSVPRCAAAADPVPPGPGRPGR